MESYIDYVFIAHTVLEGLVGLLLYLAPTTIIPKVRGKRDAIFAFRTCGAALLSSAVIAFFLARGKQTYWEREAKEILSSSFLCLFLFVDVVDRNEEIGGST